MDFNKVYESKIYDIKYEELYNFLSSQDIENISDLSIHNPSNNCEKYYETVNISIMDRRLPCEIRIRKYHNDYIIIMDINKILSKINKISYERVEYYSSTDLHCLIKQLSKILNKYIGESND